MGGQPGLHRAGTRWAVQGIYSGVGVGVGAGVWETLARCPGWIAALNEGFGFAFREESVRPQAEPSSERNTN